MEAVTPRLTGKIVRVAESQPEYVPVSVVRATNKQYGTARGKDHNTAIMAFRPSPEERQRIADGADIYVALLTFGHDQQPIIVSAGPELMAMIHRLEALDDSTSCDSKSPGFGVPCLLTKGHKGLHEGAHNVHWE